MSSPDDLKPMDEMASEYVLGTLSATRRREVEQRLPNDAALRTAVQAWEEKLLPLTALARPVQPSAQLWNRIELSIERAAASASAAVPPRPALVKPDTSGSGWWDNLKFWRGLAGTGFAAAAILAAVLVSRTGALPGNAPQFMVVLVAPQDKAPGWVVQANSPKELSLIPL
ncbi:MAG: RNA polymerase subunit sigma-70, partial [Pseudomonadota bacterium]